MGSKGPLNFSGKAIIFSKMEHFCVPGPMLSRGTAVGDGINQTIIQRNLSCRQDGIVGEGQVALRGMNGGGAEFEEGGQRCPS